MSQETHQPDVVIIGAGPAGCTLASLLAARGIDVLVLDDDQRPDLLVGESLLPAVVPLLRKLGVEEEIAAVSLRKPGASFFATNGERIHFDFTTVRKQFPPYSYNVPRPAFDDILSRRARSSGARFVNTRAALEPGDDGQPLRLAAESRKAAGLAADSRPFLIDCTGRSRLFARQLELPTVKGDRTDVAYFAHFEGFLPEEVPEGQVVISALTKGWSWRIPLPGRLSVGIVLRNEDARKLGDTPEKRLEEAIRTEPLLQKAGAGARRNTPVMSYTRYQLITEQASGPGWALAGDAFGFVDPMLSPGLFMAMESARLLDKLVFAKGPSSLHNPQRLGKALRLYSKTILDWHHAWAELIEYFYSGKIFPLYLSGKGFAERFSHIPFVRQFEKHPSFHIASMASGGNTRSRYSRALIRFLSKDLTRDVAPAEEFAIR